MKLNDENLPEEIRPKDEDQAVKPLEPEQKEVDLLGSNAFQQMFKQLRALLGDEQVRNKTA